MFNAGVAAPFMLQITAKHFVAGISPKVRSAPILYWMILRQWDEAQIRTYCQYHGWTVAKVDGPPAGEAAQIYSRRYNLK
jgi:hypothetical protein